MKAESADWVPFLEDGARYHRTAQGSVRRPEVFTPAIIQNVAAMGIEKYFMAIFLRRGTLPRNHTLSDLMKEASSFLIIEPDLAETLRFMDSLQRICSIDDYSIETPSESDVPRFLSALDAVARLAERELSLAGLPN